MRKVIYWVWIPQRFEKNPTTGGPDYTKPVEGTHKFSDQESGYFHGWGKKMYENNTTMVEDSVAIVEDVKTGVVHMVDPTNMRFVQPPTTDKPATSDVIANMILKELKNINTQLSTEPA